MKNLYSFFPKNKQLLWRNSLRLLVVSLAMLTACQQQNEKIEFVQLDEESYHAKTDDYKLYLLASAIEMKTQDDTWQMSFNNQEKIVPQKKDREILYENISPHTEMVVYDKGANKAGYDVIVHPGGNVEDVVLQLEHNGSNNEAFINGEGALLLPIEEGYLKHSPPIAYQEINGEKNIVESRFHLESGLLSFEVDAYNPEYTLVIDPEISFTTETVNKTKQILAQRNTTARMMMAPDCPPMPVVNPYIGGKTYRDIGQDGVLTAGIDQAVANVTVSVYSASGLVGTTTSSVDGDYLFENAALTPGETYRVEFSSFPSNLEPSIAGGGNGTSVQFISANSCDNNFGLINPDEYVEPNPTVVTNCFILGDNVGDPGDVLISMDYNSPTTIGHESQGGQIGSTYGLAFSKQSGLLFASAFHKRFAGFGPGTPGSIYVITDPGDNAYSGALFIDLNTLFGSSVAGTDVHDFSVVDVDPSPSFTVNEVIDGASFNMVGRTAFGDMDITEDGDSLWVVNLADRSLYGIPLGADPKNPVAPASSTDVEVLSLIGTLPGIPAGVDNAEIRPFALKYHKGKLYIGVVTNGEVTGLANMYGLAYCYNPADGTFTKVLEFPLNYDRGCAFGGDDGDGLECAGPARWNPWLTTNSMPTPMAIPSGRLFVENGHPQPIFADIEFDINDNMIIGLRDRFGDQGGYRAANPDGSAVLDENGNTLVQNSMTGQLWYTSDNDAFGDILLATPNGAAWSLNIADFTDATLSLPTATPSGGVDPCPDGEAFFGDDCYHATGFIHEETSMGGMAMLLRTNLFSFPSMDPEINAYSNGIDWMDPTSGNLTMFFTVLDGASQSVFGKGNGLGDMELITAPAPIEIGNRVWKDDNGNGIQDPGEDGINGVLVELYKETAPSTYTKVAETTTAADGSQGNGAYKFSMDGVGGQSWEPGFTEVEPDMTYEVRVSLSDLQSADPNCTGFTAANQTSDATNDRFTDLSDSDAIDNANVGVINFSTTDVGESNHSLDIGAIACAITLSNLSSGSCTDGEYTLTGDISYAGGPTPLGLITISVDNDGVTASVQIDPSSASSFSIPNLGCDGDQNVVVTASFDNDMTCSGTEMYDEPECMLNITNVSVSDCVFDGQNSIASVSVEVTWQNAPLGGNIDVTVNGQTQTIAASFGAFSPQSISFTVPADGSTGNSIAAAFTVGTCADPDGDTYDAPAACDAPPGDICVEGPGVLGGTVYLDPNANGELNGGEAGVPNITVEAYDCDGNLVQTTQTDSEGFYYFTGLDDLENYRIEFSNIPPDLKFSFAGNDNGTSVQFAYPNNCTIDLALIDPNTYCESNPPMAVPCYVNGDATGGDDVLVGFNYNSSGLGPHSVLADRSQIGTTWGLAYSRSRQILYASAFVKRHSGMGPAGPGAIYSYDQTLGTISTFVDVTALGIDIGTVPSNAMRNLPASKNQPNNDPDVFSLVAKSSLGDIDISEDESTLYIVNLNESDRAVYAILIDSDNNPATAPTAGDVTRYAVPDPGCNLGTYRPFGLKFYKGDLYVGVVCDGSNGGTTADLTATVYQLALSSGASSMTSVLNFPLTYTKGSVWGGCPTNWLPWQDNFPFVGVCGGAPGVTSGYGSFVIYPQAVLSDIEFDDDGSMILGFFDRSGHQVGAANYGLTGTSLYYSVISGDILRAGSDGAGGFVIENNASAGGNTSLGVNNNQGPGGGEYYWGDGGFHAEESMGGTALLSGTNEVVLSLMDPVQIQSGGIRWLNNTTGSAVQNFELYPPGGTNPSTFGKGNGLGDVELLCSEAPIQIGDYVFIDNDADGVQDPHTCDAPLANVNVTLYDENGNELASTQTDSEGHYYFGTADGLMPATKYYVVFGTSGQYANGVLTLSPTDVYVLTVANAGTGNDPDINDSDVEIGGNTLPAAVQDLPVICVTTATPGCSDHTYDAGFIPTTDYGDLPDGFNTLSSNNGASHAYKPGLYLGSCVDFDPDGQPSAMADGDNLAPGLEVAGVCVNNDDEDGVSLLTPLIPGSTACIEVTATSVNGTAVLNAWIDFNGDGDFVGDANENLV
ncbi:MAG: hypothetical protein MI974_23325, partial [Chitinophagales bacterium]|nr:hypothetical protein [Chitinophagales bacterium]